MTGPATGARSASRLVAALIGGVIEPPVRGLSFVDPALLPGATAQASPPVALASTCAALRLDFAFVPSWEPWALDAVSALSVEGVSTLWVVPGVVWPALEALGIDEGLRMSLRDPARLADAMNAALATALGRAAAGIEAGTAALVVADDMAGSAGPLLSGGWLGAEAFPRLARIASLAADAGLPALLHCDGDARSLFALARGAGFRGVHGDCGGVTGIGPALEATRSARIALVGGLATSDLSDPGRGARAGEDAAVLARGGGLLISDDGGLTTPRQMEALIAALEALLRP